MRLLVPADVDGELTAAEAARVAVHVMGCTDCAAAQRDITALSARLRGETTRYRAPESLRAALAAQPEGSALPPAANENRTSGKGRRFASWAPGVGLGIAVSMAVMLLRPGDGGLPEQLVADHIRALQPGHLIDIVSTDQHTVKPWFDGRLDYAPPVKDFSAQGFALAGGRLDYMAGRPVAVLVYARRKHVIDVYVWPARGTDAGGAAGTRNGYNYVQWRQDDMVYWAVSDLNANELRGFSGIWRADAGK
jgi:anti-sigma factor RsiW